MNPTAASRLMAGFVFLTLVTAAAAADWAALHGRVLDPSGAAVPGAAVTLTAREDQTGRAAFTNISGEFRFDSIPPGEYLLAVRAADLASPPPLSLSLAAGEPRTLDLRLELARVATHVQVTAAGVAESVEQVAKALDVIDRTELDRRAEYSLAEAVRLVPGLRLHQVGGPGSLARILSRGLRPWDTSVLIDGVRLRDTAAPQGDATGFIADVPIVNSSRIEVLRGSGSSLYGTNAGGGVINVVTDSGGGPLRGDVSAEGGGLGMARGLARLAGGVLDDRLRYSAGVSHLNVTRGVDGDDVYRNSALQGAVAATLAPSTTLTARLFASDSFAGLNNSPEAAAAANLPASGIVPAIPNRTFIPALNDPDSRRSSLFLSTLVALHQRLSPKASWRAAYHNLTTTRDNWDGPAGPGLFEPAFPSAGRFDGRTDTAQARADLQLAPAHLLAGGYEFERESYDNLNTDLNPDPTRRLRARLEIAQRSHAFWVQDQVRLAGDRLQVSLSGRTQGFGLDAPRFTGASPLYLGAPLAAPPRAWTGDVALAWFLPASGTKLRAHAGNGYRAPSLYERFGATFFFGSFSALGDPRLAPERLASFDAGIDQYLARSRVRLRATWFYTKLRETIAFDFASITPATDPFGRFGGYRNTGGGLARGFELSLEANPVRTLTLNSSYTYTNSDDRISTVREGTLKSFRIFDHMFTAAVTQRIGRRVDLTFDLLAAGDYLFPFFTAQGARAFRFNGPLKADLAAAYTHPIGERVSLKLFTRIENLFNTERYEDGFPTPGAWAVIGLKTSF
ncbi:MAG: TonB-dependent receptor [Acidobacteria bacterium]|nr:TonB-dependent receptor [Acidobacteriota bacterium]